MCASTHARDSLAYCNLGARTHTCTPCSLSRARSHYSLLRLPSFARSLFLSQSLPLFSSSNPASRGLHTNMSLSALVVRDIPSTRQPTCMVGTERARARARPALDPHPTHASSVINRRARCRPREGRCARLVPTLCPNLGVWHSSRTSPSDRGADATRQARRTFPRPIGKTALSRDRQVATDA